jgi:hypothetical protein
MIRPARLRITRLEDRLTPAGFGNAWVDTNVTVSLVPDGTADVGAPSSLFGTLGARMTQARWQGAIREAFQAWATPTNLNVAFVPDDGRPLGTPGPMQGSPSVGDIRISARPLSDNVIAIANPPDLVSPWAGEIFLNSTKPFGTDGDPGAYDLRTVVLHEAGHALGIAGSGDAGAVMDETYHGLRPGLAPSDVTAIQALYGVRSEDRFDANNRDDTLASAARLTYIQNPAQLAGTDGTSGPHPCVAAGDITTAGDVDDYCVTPPLNPRNPTVVVRTGGLSSARLRVSVLYQRNGEPGNVSHLLSTTSTPTTGGDYVIPITPPAGAAWYYVQVQAAPDAGPFAVGSYQLAVGNGLTAIPQNQYTTRISTPGGMVTESADWASGRPTNDTLATATRLGLAREGTDQRWDYAGTATLGSATDVDTYRVTTTAGSGSVMLVSVGTPGGGVDPSVTVYDCRGIARQAETLLRNGDATIIQVAGVQRNATYYVSVRAGRAVPWVGAEAYQLGIDFRAAGVTLDEFAAGTLTAAQPQLERTLQVTRSQGFRFQISALSTVDPVATTARLTILDGTGTTVLTLDARNNQTVIGDVLLAPGTYTFVIAGARADGSPLKGLRIDARFMALTDPIGPGLDDGYALPPPVKPTDGGADTGPASDAGFVWVVLTQLSTGFLAPTDSYSSPWW